MSSEYKPAARPSRRETTTNIVAIVICFLVIWLAVLVRSGSPGERAESEPGQAPALATDPDAAIDASEPARLRAENAVRAADVYVGKRLRLKGRVQSVTESRNSLTVRIGRDGHCAELQMNPVSDRSWASRLNKGDTVVAEGTGERFDWLGDLMLSDVVIIRP